MSLDYHHDPVIWSKEVCVGESDFSCCVLSRDFHHDPVIWSKELCVSESGVSRSILSLDVHHDPVIWLNGVYAGESGISRCTVSLDFHQDPVIWPKEVLVGESGISTCGRHPEISAVTRANNTAANKVTILAFHRLFNILISLDNVRHCQTQSYIAFFLCYTDPFVR